MVSVSDSWSKGHEFDSRPVHRQGSCQYPCASVTKQYNLIPVKGRWCSAVGKVTVGLALHWPCVTSTYGLTATEREMSTPLRSNLGAWYTLPLPINYRIISFYDTSVMTSKPLVSLSAIGDHLTFQKIRNSRLAVDLSSDPWNKLWFAEIATDVATADDSSWWWTVHIACRTPQESNFYAVRKNETPAASVKQTVPWSSDLTGCRSWHYACNSTVSERYYSPRWRCPRLCSSKRHFVFVGIKYHERHSPLETRQSTFLQRVSKALY